MKSLANRRVLGFLLTAAVTAVLLLTHGVYSVSLAHSNFRSGWILVGLMLFLAAFNLRKRVPFLPGLLSASTWLQLHIYIGVITIVVFLCHIDMRIPNGKLECSLALVFVAIVLSGILGLAISRSFARRLTARGPEFLYERIPVIRRQLQDDAEEHALRTVTDSASTTVADFYHHELKRFFDRPRFFVSHLFESQRPLHALYTKMDAVDRHLDVVERDAMIRLRELIKAKFDLDYAYTLQSLLKWWLFIHIPLSFVIFVLVFLHIIAAYAFYGGVR
jgi:hypothetical protein